VISGYCSFLLSGSRSIVDPVRPRRHKSSDEADGVSAVGGFCRLEDVMNASRTRFTSRRLIACAVAAGLLIAVQPVTAVGQVATATVQGVVTDETKALAPGATVTALNEQTGQVRAVVADDRGFYRIPALPPGRYTLTAELSGFAAVRRTGVALTIGQEVEIPFQLGSVALQETITVTSEAPLIETSKTTLGTTFTKDKLEELPLAGRNYLNLVTMAPGVTPDGGAAGMASFGRNSGRVGYQVDGVSQENNLTVGSRGNLSPDSVQEFQVLTNMFSAEYGSASGPIVNILTRSGTNDHRGSFGFYSRSNQLDARDYFAQGEAPFSQQWYSGTMGGPIVRNRLHYFGSFEGLRQDETAVVTSPLAPGEYPRETRNIKFLTKADAELGPNRLSVRYNYDRGTTTNSGVGGLEVFERGRITKPRRQDYQGTLTSVFSNTLVNEFRVQYAPLNSGNRAAQAAMNCPNCPSITRPSGNLGKPTNQPQWYDEYRLQFVDSITMTRGLHDLKAGINYNNIWTDIYFPGTQDGSFVFTTDLPFDAANPATYPARFDIVLGDPLMEVPDQLLDLFIQDSWRVRSNLTINAGLRWDWQGQHVVNKDKNNFGPRLSFTYDPNDQGTFIIRGGGGVFYDRNRGELTLFVYQAERNFTRIQIVNPGYPDPFGFNPNGTREGNLPVPSKTVVDPNKRVTESYRTSFGFMKALGSYTRITSDVVWTRGAFVLRNRDINPVDPVTFRRPDPNYGLISQQEASASTHYLGLETELERRLHQNLQFSVGYTLSKTRHDLDTPVSQLDYAEAMARAGNTHVIVSNGIYQLPKGFQVGALFRARSGDYYSILTGLDDNRDGFFTDRPAGEDRNAQDGPWAWNIDARLSKNFSFAGNRRLELIAEVFNVTNTPQFSTPENRQTSRNFEHFVAMDSAYNPRQVQLGARIMF
jgi:Carboxypeptidase regulatory-like domain/TonB-dependent Receptor Plug Domain